MAFNEFCSRSGGSNLNAGTLDGGSTEVGTTAAAEYTAGDWDSGTDIYTAPVGADMTEAVTGRWASLFHDGDTAPTTNQYLVARIANVNAGTRQITLSSTAREQLGTEVATGTGNRTLRIGGAWAHPSGTTGFPLSFVDSQSMTNAAGNLARLNVKNDAEISISAAITNANNYLEIAGYSSSYGDGGRAIINGGTSGTSYVLLTLSGLAHCIHDLEFKNNGATGSAFGVSLSGTGGMAVRCVFHGMRGNGVTGVSFIECEFYDNGLANLSTAAGATIGGQAIRCISHSNTSSNVSGFISSGSTRFVDCIAYGNGSHGFRLNAASTCHSCVGCDSYDNGGSGISVWSNGQKILAHIDSCNLVANGAFGIGHEGSIHDVIIQNCGFGSGTMANASGKISSGLQNYEESGTVDYAAGVTPWVDPDNGDFRITLAAAKNAGRGAFLQTASGMSGTVGYPDIGAAQHLDSGGSGGGARMVNIRGGADQ